MYMLIHNNSFWNLFATLLTLKSQTSVIQTKSVLIYIWQSSWFECASSYLAFSSKFQFPESWDYIRNFRRKSKK